MSDAKQIRDEKIQQLIKDIRFILDLMEKRTGTTLENIENLRFLIQEFVETI